MTIFVVWIVYGFWRLLGVECTVHFLTLPRKLLFLLSFCSLFFLLCCRVFAYISPHQSKTRREKLFFFFLIHCVTEREIKNSLGKGGVEFLVTRPLSDRPARPWPHSASSHLKPTGNLFAGLSGPLNINLVDRTRNLSAVSVSGDRVLVRQQQHCLHSAKTTLILFFYWSSRPPFQVMLTLIRNLDLDTANALLEKRFKILSNVSKESTS